MLFTFADHQKEIQRLNLLSRARRAARTTWQERDFSNFYEELNNAARRDEARAEALLSQRH